MRLNQFLILCMMLSCKKCSSQNHSKSGHVRGVQRYICKDCGCQFTDTKPRGVEPALRKLGVLLYAHFGVSMPGVARLLKVSVQSVARWIKAAADATPTTELAAAEVVQVDEMWHFVNGKKTKFGCGELFAGYHAVLLDGTSAIVLIKV